MDGKQELAARVGRTSGFFAFTLIPFLGGNHLPLYFFNIDRFWIDGFFLLSLVVALLAFYLRGKQPGRHIATFLVFAFPLTAMSAASLIYTWNTFSTLNEINTLAWSGGAALLYLTADDRDELHQALIVGSLLLVLGAVIQLKVLLPGLAQTFTGDKYGLMVREQIAPFGAFLNQNMLGGYFLYALPLAFYFVAVKKRIVYALAASALMLGILLSLSRLAMIIGLAGVLPACALLARRVDPRRWLIKLVCSLGCALLIFGVLLHGERREQASSMRSLLGALDSRAASPRPLSSTRADLTSILQAW